jgi:hypothetical protein
MLARHNHTHRIGIIIALAVAMAWQNGVAHADNADRIQPWSENPAYWQYQGQPVMLLGGSKTDHIFLLDDLKEHLDEIHAVGANYVRNTMSQREGIELKPHKLLPDGKFDMDQWNDDYWQRFQNMLKWTHERDIIVQIEVWDRFDFSQQNWEISPWNPGNNVNYTMNRRALPPSTARIPARTGSRSSTRSKACRTTTPARSDSALPGGVRRQDAGSYSLDYGHVLYCMNNETSTPAAWGQYWINFIKARAAEKGVTVWATDMFDDAYLGPQAKNAPIVFDDPEHYMFADISQVNSRNFDQTHWDRLQWLLPQVNKHPRPSNHTKIYGSGYHSFGTGGPEDGIERFWRNILGGSAAARFHRPNSGNGLNDLAKGSIMAARLLESQIKFWDVTPHMELLSDREPNEAYLAAKPGECYALYFTNGGSVGLDLSGAPGTFSITWISVAMGIPVETSQGGGYRLMDKTIEGDRVVTLSAPYKGGWVAAIVKQ